ncbi:hypothetical protein LTR53_013363 [Teratosphaeriaceae sp. CCFEE 6253]|nr:hypothetical protein LTR53_013363 [Teratosphaeriaceae sp. CCFEE 6253]
MAVSTHIGQHDDAVLDLFESISLGQHPAGCEVQQPTTNRAHTAVNFLDLPTELRQQIYGHVFVSEAEIGEPGRWFASQAALTQANSQIRNEALPIFYKNTVFTVLASRARAELLPNDESVIGFFDSFVGDVNVAMLRRVEVLEAPWPIKENEGMRQGPRMVEISVQATDDGDNGEVELRQPARYGESEGSEMPEWSSVQQMLTAGAKWRGGGLTVASWRMVVTYVATGVVRHFL